MRSQFFCYVRFCSRTDHIVLDARDTGSGIPPRHSMQVRYAIYNQKEKGTGLGLPVCFRAVRRHSIDMKIDASPNGTMFIVPL